MAACHWLQEDGVEIEDEDIVTPVKMDVEKVIIYRGSDIIWHMVVWMSKERRAKQRELRCYRYFPKDIIERGSNTML